MLVLDIPIMLSYSETVKLKKTKKKKHWYETGTQLAAVLKDMQGLIWRCNILYWSVLCLSCLGRWVRTFNLTLKTLSHTHVYLWTCGWCSIIRSCENNWAMMDRFRWIKVKINFAAHLVIVTVISYLCVFFCDCNRWWPLFCLKHTADDMSSAECSSDDEDLEECETGHAGGLG